MPELPYGAMPVPATPIGELTKWHLEIHCGRCRRRRSLRLDHLAERLGRDARVMDVLRRLTCSRRSDNGPCGGKPARVVLIELHIHGKSTRKGRSVVVVDNPGSAARPAAAW
jgi:hypothetical protein